MLCDGIGWDGIGCYLMWCVGVVGWDGTGCTTLYGAVLYNAPFSNQLQTFTLLYVCCVILFFLISSCMCVCV